MKKIFALVCVACLGLFGFSGEQPETVAKVKSGCCAAAATAAKADCSDKVATVEAKASCPFTVAAANTETKATVAAPAKATAKATAECHGAKASVETAKAAEGKACCAKKTAAKAEDS